MMPDIRRGPVDLLVHPTEPSGHLRDRRARRRRQEDLRPVRRRHRCRGARLPALPRRAPAHVKIDHRERRVGDGDRVAAKTPAGPAGPGVNRKVVSVNELAEHGRARVRGQRRRIERRRRRAASRHQRRHHPRKRCKRRRRRRSRRGGGREGARALTPRWPKRSSDWRRARGRFGKSCEASRPAPRPMRTAVDTARGRLRGRVSHAPDVGSFRMSRSRLLRQGVRPSWLDVNTDRVTRVQPVRRVERPGGKPECSGRRHSCAQNQEEPNRRRRRRRRD